MELVNWLLRKYADEQSLSDQDALFHGASQRDGRPRNIYTHALGGYVASVGIYTQRGR